jgi:hypothetical protein
MLALAALGVERIQHASRGLNGRRGRSKWRKRIAALSAETAVAAADPAATLAGDPKRRSAVLAKLVIELVPLTATEALHGDRPCSTLVRRMRRLMQRIDHKLQATVRMILQYSIRIFYIQCDVIYFTSARPALRRFA